ncbi:unnamed protein product [Caenorhabditis sp. 36 PRJEB53466]|nr:unnamed protein product [Caenorhabditis sp. 36 PRJEB53466]
MELFRKQLKMLNGNLANRVGKLQSETPRKKCLEEEASCLRQRVIGNNRNRSIPRARSCAVIRSLRNVDERNDDQVRAEEKKAKCRSEFEGVLLSTMEDDWIKSGQIVFKLLSEACPISTDIWSLKFEAAVSMFHQLSMDPPGQVLPGFYGGMILMSYKTKGKTGLCAIQFVYSTTKVYVIEEETNEWKTPFDITSIGHFQQIKPLLDRVIDVTDDLINNNVWDYNTQIQKMLIVCSNSLIAKLKEFANFLYRFQMGREIESQIAIRYTLDEILKYYVPDNCVAIGLNFGLECECAVVSKNYTSQSCATTVLDGGSMAIMESARERIFENLFDCINDPPPNNPFTAIFDIFKRTLCPNGFQLTALFDKIYNYTAVLNFILQLIEKAKDGTTEEQSEIKNLFKTVGVRVANSVINTIHQNYHRTDQSSLHIFLGGDVDNVMDLTVLEGFADQFVSLSLVKRIQLYRPTVDDVVTAVSAFNREARTNFEVKSEKWKATYTIDYLGDNQREYNIVNVNSQ